MEQGKVRKEEVQLPLETSPYVQSKDVNDYNLRGYGTNERRKPVELPQRGGGTDAPTSAGSGQPQDGRFNDRERAAVNTTGGARRVPQLQPGQTDEDFAAGRY